MHPLKIMHNRLRLSLLITLCLTAPLTFALPEDRQMPAQLAADSADLSQQNHRGEYNGKVEFDQGSTHLRAAKAVTEGNLKNELIMAVAMGESGEQAHFWTETAKDKPLLHAWADTIRYLPLEHRIELIGNARITQGENTFSAPVITYDTEKQHVTSRSDGKGRTTILIHPEKKA